VIAGLPLDDPQFWVATGAVAAAVALLVARSRRRRRVSPGAPTLCAHCDDAPRHSPARDDDGA
jgi:hypothetical protein